MSWACSVGPPRVPLKRAYSGAGFLARGGPLVMMHVMDPVR